MTVLALCCAVRRGREGARAPLGCGSFAAVSPPRTLQSFLRLAGFPNQFEKGRPAMDLERIIEIKMIALSTKCSKFD